MVGPNQNATHEPPRHCCVCGRKFAWGDHRWGHGDSYAHDTCIDFSQHPFPHDDDLEHLRNLSRALRRAQKVVDACGIWLAGVKHKWPRDAVKETRLHRERLVGVTAALIKLRDYIERRMQF